jgi:hypothetical protein
VLCVHASLQALAKVCRQQQVWRQGVSVDNWQALELEQQRGACCVVVVIVDNDNNDNNEQWCC